MANKATFVSFFFTTSSFFELKCTVKSLQNYFSAEGTPNLSVALINLLLYNVVKAFFMENMIFMTRKLYNRITILKFCQTNEAFFFIYLVLWVPILQVFVFVGHSLDSSDLVPFPLEIDVFLTDNEYEDYHDDNSNKSI